MWLRVSLETALYALHTLTHQPPPHLTPSGSSVSKFLWVCSELACTRRHTHTPDVDAEEVIEVKHVVSSNPHASVSHNNILGNQTEIESEWVRESERERQRIRKYGWGLCQYTQTVAHTYRVCSRGTHNTHTHTHGLRQWKHYDISRASPTEKIKLLPLIPNLRVSFVGRYTIGDCIDQDSLCTTWCQIDKCNEEAIPLILRKRNGSKNSLSSRDWVWIGTRVRWWWEPVHEGKEACAEKQLI